MRKNQISYEFTDNDWGVNVNGHSLSDQTAENFDAIYPYGSDQFVDISDAERYLISLLGSLTYGLNSKNLKPITFFQVTMALGVQPSPDSLLAAFR